MLKSNDIIALAPRSFIKKSNKSNAYDESDNFINFLQRQLTEWKLTYFFVSKPGKAYNLKFDHFAKDFFKEFNLVMYVVCPLSSESFRKSIKKLISTCQDKDKLSRIVVLSLDGNYFKELEESSINVVFFENHCLKFEYQNNWTVLKNILFEKLETIRKTNGSTNQATLSTLTVPIPIQQPKSPTRLKGFIQNISLPFNHEKKHSPKNSSDKSIYKISFSDKDELKTSNEHDHLNIEFKEHHSKYSLNSFFKKPTKKVKDSGLSIGSPSSSCSGSKESETICFDKCKSLDIGFEAMSDTSQCSDQHLYHYTSTLDKSKTSKAKINPSRNKTTNSLRSLKNRSIIISSFTNVATQLLATSDSIITESKVLIDRHRCDSEPPFTTLDSTISSPVTGRIKYYAWNDNMIEEENFKMFDLTFKKPKIKEITLIPIVHNASDQMRLEKHVDVCTFQSDFKVVAEYVAENINSSLNHYRKDADIDKDYYQIQYATNNKIVTTDLKNDASDKNQLRTLPEDNKQEFHEKVINGESVEDKSVFVHSFKKPCEKNVLHEREIINTNNVSDSKTRFEAAELSNDKYNKLKEKQLDLNNANNKEMQVETIYKSTTDAPECKNTLASSQMYKQSLKNPFKVHELTELEKVYDQPESYLYRMANSLINNPISVGGIFAVTALTAPFWSPYIPESLGFGHMICATISYILKNEMVQSIPNRLVSTVRESTIANDNSLRNVFIRLPN